MTNPSSFSANYVTDSWSIYTMTSALAYIDGIYSGLLATPPLIGQTVTVLLVEMDSYVVNTNTNFRILFLPGTSLTSDAIVDVYFPDGFATAASTTNICTLLQGVDFNMQCTFTNYPSGYIYKIELLNPCPSQCASSTAYIY
jgi:hypothetical protein